MSINFTRYTFLYVSCRCVVYVVLACSTLARRTLFVVPPWLHASCEVPNPSPMYS